ncbi:unnamed protein product [Brassica oleracea]|uniref:(rape) hypothetical protein n=1 Tax=Brassica napus TaxID=3708 RepID=A0A816IQY3_BRANA|nr:unnamed protein product [Brassica napus]
MIDLQLNQNYSVSRKYNKPKGPEYGTSSDFKDHLETCFGVIRREIERSGDQVSPFLLQCAEQLPHKIPLYGTLIGLLNLENEDFVQKIVESFQDNFQVALDSGNCNSIRILLRFMTSLLCSKVIQPASLIVVFQTLLSSAATTVDEEKGNPSWQAQAVFYVICILSSLPWGGAELAEQVPDEIERVLVGIPAYLSIRKHSSSSGLNIFYNGESENSLAEKDFVEDLWDRTQSLASNGWKLDSVIMDLCKALPGAFPAVVAGAVRALFEKISDLDMESRTRLILWFSHHLSNFQFIWPWEEWAYVLDLPKWAPKRVFVQDVLQREVRLSHWDKIKQTLLDIGSKSFTHLVTFLERYGQVFVKLCTDNDKQVMLLSQILGNALNKTYNRISDLRKEISSIKKNVLVAEKASANARVELEAAESKLLLVEGEPVLGDNPLKMKRLRTTVEKTGESLETKETLLNRALSETEVLLLQMFQSFSAVLKERLPEPTKARSLQDLNSTGAEDENSSAMEVDSENGNPKKGSENGERQQWCLSTLGYLTAFTRQYAKEIWPHMEKLESEVFSGDDVHPLFLQAIFSALQVPFTINSYRFIREQRRELAHLFCIF